MPRGSKPGERRGGRQKGTPNKVTAGVRAALVRAFEERGGVPALIEWSNENPAKFYEIWAKLLPQEVKAEVDAKGTITIEVVKFTDA